MIRIVLDFLYNSIRLIKLPFLRSLYPNNLKSLLLIALCLLGACTQKSSDKQVIRLNIYTEPPCLDPRRVVDLTSFNILIQLFEGLTRLDQDDLPQFAGAKKIDLSDDALTYTIELRDSFWSNGEPVTVEDYVDTWKEILDPLYPSPFAYKLFVIKNARAVKAKQLPLDAVCVKKIDEKHFQITLEHPAPYFLELLAFPTFYPINRCSVKKNEEWSGEAGPLFVSNGPFKLIKWLHDGELVLNPNPHYWDCESVNLDRIEFCMIEDAITEFYMFEQKELDWCGSPLSSIPPEVLVKLNEQGRLNVYDTTGCYFLQINTNRFPLGNINIRRALGLAINRQELIDHVYMIDHYVAKSIVPSMRNFETPLSCYEDASFETAKALFKKGLEEEGLDLKSFPTLTISYNACKQHQKVMQAIQQQWREQLGIHVNLVSSDWKAYLYDIAQQNYDICRFGWVGEYQDPITYLLLFRTKGGDSVNYTGWHDDRYQELLDLSIQERSHEVRKQQMQEAESILMAQMPIIPICHMRFAYLKNPKVKGIHASKFGAIDLKYARCE